MQKQKKKKIGLIVAFGVAAAFLLGAACLYFYVTPRYDGAVERRLYIDGPSGSQALRDSLCATLGDSYGNRVYSLWEHFSKEDGKVLSGSYIVKPGTEAYSLARRIAQGRQDPIKFTFNNLRTFPALAARVGATLQISSDDFTAATDSLLRERGVTRREAYAAMFLPDTYEFYWSDSADKVVKTLLYYYDRFWTFNRKDKARNLGLSLIQVATLASIVEEETAKADERPVVARLYLNRLAKGMRLQADPTVKFAFNDPSIRRITRDMLSVRSPYNTYLHQGLPPGPIRIPEAATLDYVLDAPDHSYIYMCARPDFSGYHNFTSDYAVHQENGRRYRRALDARGITR